MNALKAYINRKSPCPFSYPTCQEYFDFYQSTYYDMVKANPQKEQLRAGVSAPQDIFRSMDLEPGDIFENNRGITLKIEPTPFSDKWRVQPMEETELEKTTESILTDRLNLISGTDFIKQHHIPELSKSYSIDFAFPVLRLAVEPHGSHLRELNDGSEEEKKSI